MKHPVLENKRRLIVWWLVWLFVGAAQSLLFYYAYGSFENIGIADSLLSFIIFSGIALSLWYPFSYFNKAETKTVSLVTNLVASGAISITLWAFLTRSIMLLAFADEATYLVYWETTFPYRIGTGVFIYGMIILSYYLFVSINNLSEKNAREARLEAIVRDTELRMLRSQINPHFLFNSLNSISSLTITDPEKARNMVVKLSDFMRYSLSRKDEMPVTLQSELENLRLYLDIEKVRFGERLEIEENIEPACMQAKMPVMLLQPLYENAIKHGVYETTEKITISTSAKCIDGTVEIRISNNFDPEAPQVRGTGTGLLNVSRRIELMYGNTGSIKTEKLDSVFTVKMYLPADFEN